jgi:hypothetical protein
LVVRNDRFLALGLNPTTLSEGLLEEVRLIASKYKDRVDPSKIVCRSVWRKGMEVAPDLQVSVLSGDTRASRGGSGIEVVADSITAAAPVPGAGESNGRTAS